MLIFPEKKQKTDNTLILSFDCSANTKPNMAVTNGAIGIINAESIIDMTPRAIDAAVLSAV